MALPSLDIDFIFPFRYEFHHAIWHWGKDSQEGSEHYLNGVQYPMEVQLFHWNTRYADYKTASGKSDGLAAVSFFYEVTAADNPAISGQIKIVEEVVDSVNGVQAEHQFFEWPNLEKEFPISLLSQLLPAGGLDASDEYFYYNGSLTLPNTTTLNSGRTFDEDCIHVSWYRFLLLRTTDETILQNSFLQFTTLIKSFRIKLRQ